MTQELGPNQLRWLTALESGEYAQGKYALHRENDGFCCLGVACELFKTDAVELGECDDGLTYDENWETAPRYVRDALSLFSDEGHPKDRDQDLKLTHLNDSGKTFKEIAEIVRADPSNYFAGSF